MNIGNDRSAATKLKILISGAPSIGDAASERAKGEIDFDARGELYNGAVKRQVVGALVYTITILSVEKYGESAFYMDRISIQVDVAIA